MKKYIIEENFDFEKKEFKINTKVLTENFGNVFVLKILEKRGPRNYYQVKFENSNNEYIVSDEVLKKGSLRDTELIKKWELEKIPYPTFDKNQREIDLSFLNQEFISNKGEKCIIIEFVGNLQRSKLYKVRFLETLNEDIFYLHHLKTKNFYDKKKIFLKIGNIYKSNNYGYFKILNVSDKREGQYYDIQFFKTNYIKKDVNKKEILNGKVYDPYFPSNSNHGFIGEGKYEKTKDSFPYSTWDKILRRCYNEKEFNYMSYGGKGTKVHEKWYNFQNFAEWFYKNKKKDWELDKDIICNIKNISPKIYSEDTCIFIPPYINGFLSTDRPSVGVYPFIDEDCITKYKAKIGSNYKEYDLGIYNSFKEAKIAYAKKKKELWINLLNEYKEDLGEELYNLCLQYDFSWGLLKS